MPLKKRDPLDAEGTPRLQKPRRGTNCWVSPASLQILTVGNNSKPGIRNRERLRRMGEEGPGREQGRTRSRG